MSYTIGQAAVAAGVTPRAVRLYETRGLLPPADRTPAGYRVFSDEHVEVLTFIRQARSLGLSLDNIAEIARLADDGTTPCEQTYAFLDDRIREIDQAIADLQGLRHTITNAQRARPPRAGTRCAVIETAAQSN